MMPWVTLNTYKKSFNDSHSTASRGAENLGECSNLNILEKLCEGHSCVVTEGIYVHTFRSNCTTMLNKSKPSRQRLKVLASSLDETKILAVTGPKHMVPRPRPKPESQDQDRKVCCQDINNSGMLCTRMKSARCRTRAERTSSTSLSISVNTGNKSESVSWAPSSVARRCSDDAIVRRTFHYNTQSVSNTRTPV